MLTSEILQESVKRAKKFKAEHKVSRKYKIKGPRKPKSVKKPKTEDKVDDLITIESIENLLQRRVDCWFPIEKVNIGGLEKICNNVAKVFPWMEFPKTKSSKAIESTAEINALNKIHLSNESLKRMVSAITPAKTAYSVKNKIACFGPIRVNSTMNIKVKRTNPVRRPKRT